MEITFDSVSKTIRLRRILQDVSFRFESGSVVGLDGINGSGKTMIMRALCGLIHIDDGFISVSGELIGKDVDSPRSLGLLIEKPAFLDSYTGFQNLEMLARLARDCERGELFRVLERVGLDPLDGRRCKAYSLGMRQRLGLAAAIMQEPQLIVLDEPTNALDSEGVELVIRIVREERARGAAVLVASHDRDAMRRMADRIYHVSDGRIIGVEEVCHDEA